MYAPMNLPKWTSSKTTSRGQFRKQKRETNPSASSTHAVCVYRHRGGGGGASSFSLDGEDGPASSSSTARSLLPAPCNAIIASREREASIPSSLSRLAHSTRSRPLSPPFEVAEPWPARQYICLPRVRT
eukprot:scaffold13457_cov56-Phaeocystis_antarctica.AAC.3